MVIKKVQFLSFRPTVLFFLSLYSRFFFNKVNIFLSRLGFLFAFQRHAWKINHLLVNDNNTEEEIFEAVTLCFVSFHIWDRGVKKIPASNSILISEIFSLNSHSLHTAVPCDVKHCTFFMVIQSVTFKRSRTFRYFSSSIQCDNCRPFYGVIIFDAMYIARFLSVFSRL